VPGQMRPDLDGFAAAQDELDEGLAHGEGFHAASVAGSVRPGNPACQGVKGLDRSDAAVGLRHATIGGRPPSASRAEFPPGVPGCRADAFREEPNSWAIVSLVAGVWSFVAVPFVGGLAAARREDGSAPGLGRGSAWTVSGASRSRGRRGQRGLLPGQPAPDVRSRRRTSPPRASASPASRCGSKSPELTRSSQPPDTGAPQRTG